MSTGTRPPRSAVTLGSRLINSGSCRTSNWRGTSSGLPRNPRRETPARKTNPWVHAATALAPLGAGGSARTRPSSTSAHPNPSGLLRAGGGGGVPTKELPPPGSEGGRAEHGTGRGTKPRLCGRHRAGPSAAPSGRRGREQTARGDAPSVTDPAALALGAWLSSEHRRVLPALPGGSRAARTPVVSCQPVLDPPHLWARGSQPRWRQEHPGAWVCPVRPGPLHCVRLWHRVCRVLSTHPAPHTPRTPQTHTAWTQAPC